MPSSFVKFSNSEDDPTLFSRHYVLNVLPDQSEYQAFSAQTFIEWITGSNSTIQSKHRKFKEAKEHNTEDELIKPVLRQLGHQMASRPNCNAGEIDIALYSPIVNQLQANSVWRGSVVYQKRCCRIGTIVLPAAQ